ncbi:M48 family metalloprotease [Sphingomonas sp. CJ99]
MTVRNLLLATAALSLAACGGTTAAQTRPASAGQAQPITAAERQQGQQISQELIQQFGGAWSGPQVAYVTRVGRNIAVQSGLSAAPSDFTVTVLDSPVDNAFATPGGYIYVTRGLMALMNDEAELAAVLGHEVGHVAARHSQSRQRTATRNSILGVLGQVLVGAVAGDGTIGRLLNQGISTGAQLATLGYSRSQETQADQLGVRYLNTARLDTDALSSMLASLAAQNSLNGRIQGQTRSVPAFASTHPEPQARVRTALNDANRTGGTQFPRNREPFLAAVDGLLYGDNPRQGVIQGRDFLHPDLRIAFTAPQGFTMSNSPSAVTIAGGNVQAQFSMRAYSGNLESYVRAVLGDLAGQNAQLPQTAVQRTTVNGLQAAYTTTRANANNQQLDVTVFAYQVANDRAYHFTVLAPAGQGLGGATGLVQSFRALTSAQAAQIKPRYVRVVTVRAGDTVQSLAGRMAFDDFKLERFLVLNGLASNATVRTGDRVKIVAY